MTKINELNTVLENGGTEATDALRLEVAAVFARQLRSSDMFGRFAGDLYLLVLPQATHEEALMIADRIAAEAANLRVLATAQPITLSIGITEAVAGDTFSTLLSRADTALFQATADVKSRRRAVLAPGSTTSKSQDQEVVAR